MMNPTTVDEMFPDRHGTRPARLFASIGAMREFVDYLIRTEVSYRVEISRPRRKYPRQVAVIYVGPAGVRPDCQHVMPIDDLREHITHASCWCAPEEVEDDLFVHNSLDRREDSSVH